MKRLLFGNEAREKLLEGAGIVHTAVSSTLGPKANNVAIAREWGEPIVVHDGVTVSREVVPLEDAFANVGAELIKGAADKMDSVGDGTTLTTILTYAIAQEGNRNIVAGANPMMLRKGINQAVEKIVQKISELAVPVTTDAQIKQIATISAQDEEIGNLIAGSIKKLGRDAIITVEESGSGEMSVDYKEGMAFDKGYQTHYFINKPETSESIIENPFILITDYRIQQIPEFIAFLKTFSEKQEGTPNMALVIISNGVEGAPLATLIQNKLQGNIQILCVNAPGVGDKQKDFLQDIAIATGGTLVSKELGLKLENTDIAHLGRAKKIIATKDATTIIGGEGNKISLEQRILELKSLLENTTFEFDREKLQERLAKLTSGIAIINVGAASDAELREKKERCIDAIAATKAAIEEGIVPGGETTLITASPTFEVGEESSDIVTGRSIVLTACQAPFSKLMENSGYTAGEMIERLKNNPGKGIDVMDGKVKDMIKAGIVDPAKVLKQALKNAASSAIMLITTNTIIIDVKEQHGEE